jgi:hypothetical protein
MTAKEGLQFWAKMAKTIQESMMKWGTFLAVGAVSSALLQARAQTYDTNNDFVQTFAGSGFYGYVDGQGTQTMFFNPSSLVADTSSNLFVLDPGNYRIRKITPDAIVTTFVGGGGLSAAPATERMFTLMQMMSVALWQLTTQTRCGLSAAAVLGYFELGATGTLRAR